MRKIKQRENLWKGRKKDDEAIGGKEIGTIIYVTRSKLAWNEGLPLSLSLSLPISSSLSISPQTTCWHCLVYSRNKMLIKRGWNYCTCMDKVYGQGTPFISLPSSYPSSPFTLDLRDFRLHARVCITGRRLMSAHPRKTSSSSSSSFSSAFSWANLEQLTDRHWRDWSKIRNNENIIARIIACIDVSRVWGEAHFND